MRSTAACLAAALGADLAASPARAGDVERFLSIKDWDGTFQVTLEETGGAGDSTEGRHGQVSGHFHLTALISDAPHGGGLPLDIVGRLSNNPQYPKDPRLKDLAEKIPVTWTGTWSGSGSYDLQSRVRGKTTATTKGSGSLSGMVVLQIRPSGYFLSVQMPSPQLTCEHVELIPTPTDRGPTPVPCPALPGFSDEVKPLPSGRTFSGSGRPKGVSKRAQAEFHYSVSGAGLKADLSKTKTPVERGETKLDGTASKGDINSWNWTLKPVCEYGKEDQDLQGPTPSVVLLCATKVTLEVSDGKETDKDERIIEITPRDWHTEFPEDRPGGPIFSSCGLPFGCNLGRNVCAFHGGQTGDEWVHYDTGGNTDNAANRKWDYDRTQVKGGPFDGLWYVSAQHLKVSRLLLLNRDLVSTGARSLAAINAKKGTGADFQRLIVSARVHEKTHSKLARQVLVAQDPAKDIEGRVNKDEESLKQEVDEVIWQVNVAMKAASTDTNVHADMRANGWDRPAIVWVWNDGAPNTPIKWEIPSLADLGDESQ